MGFEFNDGANLLAKECHVSSFITLDTKSRNSSRYPCNKRDPQTRVCEDSFGYSSVPLDCGKLDTERTEDQKVAKKKPMPPNETQFSLRREILELEERLRDQFIMRHSLEHALGYNSSMTETSNDSSLPKPAKELIREIAVLELEVMHLEHYLLSLYRKAYDQQNFTSSKPGELRQRLTSSCQPKSFQELSHAHIQHNQSKFADYSIHGVLPHKSSKNMPCDASTTTCSEKLNGSSDCRSHSALSQRAVSSALTSCHEASLIGCSGKLHGHGVYRSHSALSQRAVYSALMSPHAKDMREALDSFHSEPLPSVGCGQRSTSQVISLAECLGTRIADHVPETPNRLSEDLLRCIGSIYCRLAEPPLVHPVVPSTPTSSFSSMSAYSPQYVGDTWSPVGRKDSSFDARLENPFQIEGLREHCGPYSTMIEVPSICTDTPGLGDDGMLRNYRSIIRRLEKVDVRKMKNEEKLAFWINIHNALIMHAYIQHGIPQNYLKRSSLLLKANCNIGGRLINADVIQNYILGHRTHRPGQWLRTLLSPRLKLRAGDEWQTYAIEQPEPLLHFALSSGSHSDPAVRIYNPKRIFQQLETAKQEYIRATISVYKEHKIFIPNIVESFAKQLNLNVAETVKMIQHYLTETLVIAMQRCQVGRTQKCIECIPHNFAFRYLMSREVAGPLIS